MMYRCGHDRETELFIACALDVTPGSDALKTQVDYHDDGSVSTGYQADDDDELDEGARRCNNFQTDEKMKNTRLSLSAVHIASISAHLTVSVSP